MRIVYSRRALRDIEEILFNVGQRNTEGARKLSVAIERTIESCARRPRTGIRTDEPNVYRYMLGKRRNKYTIFYRLLGGDEGIEVARVLHSARIKTLGRVPEDE